jgi:hypothetical protein
MYCRSFFSAKQLHGKDRQAQHDMLHAQGKNWTTDLDPRWRNGTWLINTENGIEVRHDIQPSYQEIATVANPLLVEKTDGN